MQDFVCWEDDDQDLTIAHLLPHRIPALDEREHELYEPGPCAEWFPRDLVIPTHDPQTPPKNYRPGLYNPYLGWGERMTDILPNAFCWQVVSPRLRAFLEQEISPEEIEFLPIHVKRAEQVLPYFIARPLMEIDCIDHDRTDGVESAILRGNYLYIRRLVLDPAKIPAGVRFFRPARTMQVVLVETALAQAIVEADHEGAFFSYVEDYGMEWRGRED